ncbi:MAG: hypothetical protein QOJ42_4759 [Acidobacteriaceae bacterium]|nr:hypothetical protein [Acidobacteriaceae bacterium]
MDLDLVTTATVDITRSDRTITGTTADITNSSERTTTESIRIPTTDLSITTDPTGITITGTGIATTATIDSRNIAGHTSHGSAKGSWDHLEIQRDAENSIAPPGQHRAVITALKVGIPYCTCTAGLRVKTPFTQGSFQKVDWAEIPRLDLQAGGPWTAAPTRPGNETKLID